MKFKFLGVIWDFSYVFILCYMFTGMMIMGLCFWLDTMETWEQAVYGIVAVCYIATQGSVYTKFANNLMTNQDKQP